MPLSAPFPPVYQLALLVAALASVADLRTRRIPNVLTFGATLCAIVLQTSTDGTNWTTVYATTAGNGGFDDLVVNGTGRYVRMNGQTRATAYGYSLWEFGIYR